jgi:hypothetical protein
MARRSGTGARSPQEVEERIMKDPSQILQQKEMDIERVRRQIEALHFVIPLLAEDTDWIEQGMAPPPSPDRAARG